MTDINYIPPHIGKNLKKIREKDLSASTGSTHVLTETQEHDVINALKQLANACRQQASFSGVESLSVRIKRQNAEKLIEQFNL